jgi:hypothetical protein
MAVVGVDRESIAMYMQALKQGVELGAVRVTEEDLARVDWIIGLVAEARESESLEEAACEVADLLKLGQRISERNLLLAMEPGIQNNFARNRRT